MAQFGSGRSIIAQNQSAVSDSNGNLIVSPDDSWNASPLGIAARNQVAIGVPNGTFNILPADPVGDISAANPLPYWDWAPDDGFVAVMAYDTTTQTNSIEIDPTAVGTALGTAVLRTRLPITNDEGLDIRQYVSSSLVQVIKVAGTDKWTATLTSQYYDTTGSAIGTPYVIGTIGERGTATNLASYTNASGAISTTAAELELAYTVVVGTASPTYALQIKSVMVATEYGVIGGGGGGGTGFIPLSVITAAGDLIKGAAAGSATVIPQGDKDQVLTVTGTALGSVAWQDLPANPTPSWTYQEFTTSGTFTVPSGVSHVNVWATGGGQGGGNGGLAAGTATTQNRTGGNAGRSSYWALRRDIYVADVATVVIGIGSGGSGGTANTFSKAATGTATSNQLQTNGSNGGNTTFGTYFTVQGGSAATDAATGFYGLEQLPGTAGGAGGVGSGSGGTGIVHSMDAYGGAPLVNSLDFSTSGSAGIDGSGSGGTGASGFGGAANSTRGFSGSGGGGGGGAASSSSAAGAGGVGGPGGGGSGGGGAARYISGASQTLVVTGGAGAPAQQWGAGGGGGGAAALSSSSTANYTSATITMNSGAGGAGKAGRLYVFWLVNL